MSRIGRGFRPSGQKLCSGLTVRFFAGEQAVAENLVPMLEAAWALERFDWLMYLSTFVMEECKHAEFFAQWHERVPGILEPDELRPTSSSARRLSTRRAALSSKRWSTRVYLGTRGR